jgi:hypothetical protein
MQFRQTHTQAIAAAKAGFSERSARRFERDPRLPSQKSADRRPETRPDALAVIWAGEVVPLLEAMPNLRPITILEELERRHPDRSDSSAVGWGRQRRTLERRDGVVIRCSFKETSFKRRWLGKTAPASPRRAAR